MKENDLKFPKIDKALTDFLNDEDGNIARNKLVSIGSLILLMSILSIDSVFAHGSHSSHSSHSSHKSHSSTAYIRDHTNHGSHSDHSSHSDHGSHSSHSSHTSHSNTSSHSNSLYSDEGDVTYGPKVSEIPKVTVSPVENNEIIDFSNVTDVSTEEATEANTTLLNMNLPEIPKADNVGEINDTGLEFKTGTGEALFGLGSLFGSAAALTAGGVGAAKIGIDKVREKARLKKLAKSAELYFDEYTDDSIGQKITELKEIADLKISRSILEQLSYESIFEYSKIDIDACMEKIDSLQKALENNPTQKDSAERFASYYIPETIGILMRFVQYANDKAPEDDLNIVYEKAKESLSALNEAIDEKIDNIYQYSTMETVAKADALNKILTQNGYKKDE